MPRPDIISPSEATDATYEGMLRQEQDFWERSHWTMESVHGMVPEALLAHFNERYTGDASRTWFEELARRGPFERAGMLGATAGYYESRWLLLEGSRQLDVFDLGEGIGRRTRERLEEHGLAERCDFIHADLNFTALPREQYDVVFAVSTLHHLVRLEHAFSEIARALRPGGLFAFYEYVGPRRVQFDDSTLGRSAEVLATIPEKYVRADVTNVPETDLSPFEAYRSDEIVPLARAAFEELWFADSVVFTSLYFRLDLPTLERERPDIIERLVGLEREASRDGVPGSTAYAVYQKR